MTDSDRIKEHAYRLGFHVVGISLVTAMRPEATQLDEWLQRDSHGNMSWMARTAAKRKNPAVLLPGIRSIVSVGMNYYTDSEPDDRPDHGRIARYARGEDYHRVLGFRLQALSQFIDQVVVDSHSRAYVDTGPVMEKAWAQRGGLGWIGKHSNLVSPEYGSWLLLGEVLTTAALDADEPGSDLCGTCTLCLRACPTGAITEAYVVDARRCLSYFTIEERGRVPKEYEQSLGNRIFGCDDCLDVCPFNRQAVPTTETAFQPAHGTLNPDLDHLANQSADEFRSVFKTSAVRRATHEGLQRSVTLALSNARSASGHDQIADSVSTISESGV
jgi:epoxyqueuosine reductase